MSIDKKGVMKAGILVFVVGLLLFFVVNGLFGLAQTPEEEKQQLEAELSQLQSQLNVLSAGLGQDFGGLLCGVHNQRFNFSDFIADAHNLASLANVSTNGSVNQFVDDGDSLMEEDIVRIMLRIEEIRNRLMELEEN